MSVLGEHLDLPAFMRYVAAQNFVAQNDGFLGYDGMNNFYFYRLENSTQHVFIAWDEDNAFCGVRISRSPTRHDENVLMRKAMQVPELRDEYYNGLREAIALGRRADRPRRPRLARSSKIRRQLDLIVERDARRSVKPYTFDESRDRAQRDDQFARERVAQSAIT